MATLAELRAKQLEAEAKMTVSEMLNEVECDIEESRAELLGASEWLDEVDVWVGRLRERLTKTEQ